MPGMPLTPYLADVLSAFQPGAELAGYGTPSATPVVSGAPLPTLAPPANPTGFPSLADVPPAPPPQVSAGPIGPPAPPPPPGMSLPTDNPEALVSQPPPNMSVGPAPPQMGVEAGPPPAAPAPRQDPHAFDLTPTMGGGAPAHEVETRGPTVLNAQAGRNEAVGDAITTVAGRNDQAAQDEYAMAVSQERAARVREDALQQSLAEQQDELQARQDDFDTTARQMSRLGQIDPNRFYNSRSTVGKIAAFTELALAGFRNAPSMVMKRIDDDVKAQEFAYNAARDQLGARQTAFSAAMAKYQNAGAARAMARVAAIDVQSAQLGQIAAKNKGNETGNRAIDAMAQLATERMMQIQQGVRFVPATAGGRFYQNPVTGLIYNEKEAHEYEAKNREMRQQDAQERAKVGGQLLVQRDKAEIEAGPDGSPLTKEQRGKMEMERIERQKAADAFNEQIDHAKSLPELKKLGPVLAAREHLGPNLDESGALTAQTIHTLNSQVLNSLGKIAKDNEGKPGIAMLDEYRSTFNIPVGSSQAYAQKKLEDARSTVNAFYRQQGIDVQRPNGAGITDKEAGQLEKSTSFKAH